LHQAVKKQYAETATREKDAQRHSEYNEAALLARYSIHAASPPDAQQAVQTSSSKPTEASAKIESARLNG